MAFIITLVIFLVVLAIISVPTHSKGKGKQYNKRKKHHKKPDVKSDMDQYMGF